MASGEPVESVSLDTPLGAIQIGDEFTLAKVFQVLKKYPDVKPLPGLFNYSKKNKTCEYASSRKTPGTSRRGWN